MASNVTLSGIAKDYVTSLGGIRRALIASYDEVTAKTVTDNKITAVTTTPATAFKLFEFKKNTGSFTTTVTKDAASGSLYYSTEIVLQFLRMEAAKQMEIAALAVGDIAVIVEDANGKYWYFGYDEPVALSAGTAQSGTAKADMNGYNITLLDEANEMPHEVDPAIIPALLGLSA